MPFSNKIKSGVCQRSVFSNVAGLTTLGLALLLNIIQAIAEESVCWEQLVEVEGHDEYEWECWYDWDESSYEICDWVPYWVEGDEEWQTVCTKISSSTEPIDTATGNNYFTEPRLYVPCPGLPLQLNLKYQSKSSQSLGMLGKGWVHSYEWFADTQASQAVVYTGLGGRCSFEHNADGTYAASGANGWTFRTNANEYVLGLPAGVEYVFNTNGSLATIRDAWSNRVDCAYDGYGCLSAVMHSNGRSLVFSNEWDVALVDWRIASVSVSNGASLVFSYNGDGQFTQVVEQVGADSHVSTYAYQDGFLTNRVDGAGHNYAYGYGTNNVGGLTGKGTHLSVDGYYAHDVEYVDSYTTDVIYDTRGMDQIYRYSRNENGTLSARYGPAEYSWDVASRGIRYTYAPNGADIASTTLFDNSTAATWSEWMLYDGNHNVTNYAVAYGSTSPVQQCSIEYDPVYELPSAIELADGLRIEAVYTNASPLVVKEFYDGSNSFDTCFGYGADGLLRSITNANKHVMAFGYDAQGNMTEMALAIGPSITNGYDALGYLNRSELLAENGASSGRIFHADRDAKGRILQFAFPDNLTESYAYNAMGYLTNTVDRAGRATEYTYAPGRTLMSITRYLEEAGSNVPVRISADYDQQMNTLAITEPRGRYVESYQFDIQDRVVAVTNIEQQVMTVDYALGNAIEKIVRFDGTSLTNAYDHAGRNTMFSYFAAGALQPTTTVALDYYDDNMLKTVGDGTSMVSNSYDRLNQLTMMESVNPALHYSESHEYDPVGNTTSSDLFYLNSYQQEVHLATTNTYDEAERLETRGSHAYVYNPENDLLATVSNTVDGIATSYAYDLMDRVTNITHRTASRALIRSLDYAYDAAGMITNKTIVDDASSFVSHAYRYDSLDRLGGETRTATGSPARSTEYSYDLAGNRLTKTIDGLGSAYTLGTGNLLASTKTIYAIDYQGTSSEPIGTDIRWGELWVSNAAAQAGYVPRIDGGSFWIDDLALVPGTNRLVAAIRDQAGNMGFATNTVYLSAANTLAQYQYDAAGCLTNLNGTALAWDERYRLVNVDGASSSVAYAYDVLGRKSSRTESSVTEHYLYDGDHVLADLYGSLWQHRVYAYGPGIDNILTMTVYPDGSSSGTTYHYLKDLQNSVIALTDASGNVVESYEYDAYGNTRVFNASGTELATSAYGNRYAFQGREIDWATGLYYFRARWYDPGAGRWVSNDPIGIAGGMNLYAFCENNPVNFVDPFGLERKNGEEYLDKIRAFIDAGRIAADQRWWVPRAYTDMAGGLALHSGPWSPLDLKGQGSQDTYCVDDEEMEADEFGNYLAGYYAGYTENPLLYIGVRVGGWAWATGNSIRRGGGESFRDEGSAPYIKNGRNRGRKNAQK